MGTKKQADDLAAAQLMAMFGETIESADLLPVEDLGIRKVWSVSLGDLSKTYDHYLLQVTQAVKNLFAGTITEDQFVDTMADIIPAQLTRAWNEGMRENDLDPMKDMTPEWLEELQDIIANEYAYVDRFAADMVAASAKGGSVVPYTIRAGMWANRYKDVVNRAALETAPDNYNMEWRLGKHILEHCPYCKALNGIVASAAEWKKSGVRPASPPNDALTGEMNGKKGCQGWQCGCELRLTDKRRSKNAYKAIMLRAGLRKK